MFQSMSLPFFKLGQLDLLESGKVTTLHSNIILVVWRCPNCGDCGIRPLDSLLTNHDDICFCSNKIRKKDLEEYIGRQYHELIILDIIRRTGYRPLAVCKCSCGNCHILDLNELKKEHGTKTCGHSMYANYSQYIGQKFNHLTILETKGPEAIVFCDICGSVTSKPAHDVISGRLKTCGCGVRIAACKTRKINNFYERSDNLVEVELGGSASDIMICDSIVWKFMKNIYWSSSNSHYATTHILNKHYKFHSIILAFDPLEDFVIDHIDRNPLNNTYSNLRVVTQRSNNINRKFEKISSTGVVGVHHHNAGAYLARITDENGNDIRKLFYNLEEAKIWREQQELIYQKIQEMPSQRLINNDGTLNINFPFHLYPDLLWEKLKIDIS